MKLDDEVLAVLSRATVAGNALTLTGQLDRKLYERTNKALEAAGGKWKRQAKAHLFDADAAERVEQMLATGEVAVPKDEFNYFPSPPAVVARLLQLADIKRGMRLLEPSAGRGAIALACAGAGAVVDCYEWMEANAEALAALGRPDIGVSRADFLAVTPAAAYDRVVMNPPFMKQLDIKHVLHALKFLKPDGLLVTVMASSVTFRDNKLTQDFRDLVRARGGDIEALPDGSFKASGTAVNTVIVTIPAA